jgi:hypothetical protein
VTNRELAEHFYLIADLLELKGEVIYKILAYRKAGDSLLALGREAEDIYREGKLTDIPGVGKAIAEKIEELLTTGSWSSWRSCAPKCRPLWSKSCGFRMWARRRPPCSGKSCRSAAWRSWKRLPGRASCAICRAWGPNQKPAF